MLKNDMKNMDVSALREHVDSLRKELFNMKFDGATEQMKDSSQCKKIRKNIARALTFIHMKQQ